jgi:hypothetical protein
VHEHGLGQLMVTADRTVLIFSPLDIFRGDIISQNLGSLFPKEMPPLLQ